MANINISFNTKDKKCSVSVNGQILDNVNSVLIDKYEYNDEEEAHIEITMREVMEDDGMAKVTRLYASKQDKENALSIDDLETYADSKFERLREAACRWLGKSNRNDD